jgi:hypothetical protein
MLVSFVNAFGKPDHNEVRDQRLQVALHNCGACTLELKILIAHLVGANDFDVWELLAYSGLCLLLMYRIYIGMQKTHDHRLHIQSSNGSNKIVEIGIGERFSSRCLPHRSANRSRNAGRAKSAGAASRSSHTWWDVPACQAPTHPEIYGSSEEQPARLYVQ